VYKVFGNSMPALANDLYLTEVGSAGALFDALIFTWGAAMDRFSYK